MMASATESDRKHVMETVHLLQNAGKIPTFYDIVFKLQGIVDLQHCEAAVQSLIKEGKLFNPIELHDTTVIELTKHGKHDH